MNTVFFLTCAMVMTSSPMPLLADFPKQAAASAPGSAGSPASTAAEKSDGAVICVFPDPETTREVIVYFDPNRPPIIEHYWRNEPTQPWELTFIHFDSDGDWRLDSALGYFSGKFFVEVYFSHTRNTERLFARADFFEGYLKVRSFGHDLMGNLRSIIPPENIGKSRRQFLECKEYQEMMAMLKKVPLQLAPRDFTEER